MTDLVIRPLDAGEDELFTSMPDPGLVGPGLVGRVYSELVGRRMYRPEWTWVALRDGKVVARAAWWAGPGEAAPIVLDWLDVADGEPPATGAALLRAAPFSVEYCLLLPPGWRQLPEVAAAARLRLDATAEAGMKPLVERLHYEWTPADGLPERPDRLTYVPAPDDDGMRALLRRIHPGSLDAHTAADVERLGAQGAVQEDLDILKWFPSPREWWRVGLTPGGEVAGISIPSANYSGPVIGLIGVVAEQRGHGYGYDLLCEATHILVEHDARKITAETDVTNTPMAAAFARAGYPVSQERVFMH
jgi:hypothetical protein